MADDDKDPNIQPLTPPLSDDIVLTTEDKDAVDQGLNDAFAQLDKLALNVADTSQATVVPEVQVSSSPTLSAADSSSVESGVVSPETAFSSTVEIVVEDETPTPVPSGLSSAGQINFKKLDQAHRALKKEVKAGSARELLKDQTIYQLQQQVQSLSNGSQLAPQVVEELNSLREFRDIFGIEHHSEFVKQYDQAILEYGSRISKVLTDRGMPLTIAQAAESVRESKKEVPISVESLAKVGFENINWAFWDTSIFPGVSGLEKRQIEDALLGILNTKEARQQAINVAVSKRAEYLQRAEAIRQAELKAEETTVYAELEEYYKIAPWAKRIVLRGSETPDQKRAIENHNRQIDKYETLFAAAYNPQNIKQRVQVAAMAVLCERQTMEIPALRQALEIVKAENLKLKSKIEGVKAATSIRKSHVDTSASLATNGKLSSDELSKMNDRQAVEYAMAQAGL